MEEDSITIYEFDIFRYWTGNTKTIGLEDGVAEWWTRSQPSLLPEANQYMVFDGLEWSITDLARPVINPIEAPVDVSTDETPPELL